MSLIPHEDDQLDKIIQDMKSEGKQEEQHRFIEYLTERDGLFVYKAPSSTPTSTISTEHHTPGHLTRNDLKQLEAIDLKFLEQSMDRARER